MILVCYDFDATVEGNIERAMMREELTRKPFYAKMMTQSVYYLPESMASLETVRGWATSTNAEIFVFGNVNATIADKQKMAKQYVSHLRGLVNEMKDIAKIVRRDLFDFEETDFDDPKVNLRGWHTKVSGIENRYEELRKAINRVGDEDDELDLDMMTVYINNLKARFERVKEMKERAGKRK